MLTLQARKILFNRELDPIQTVLATGETLAHLNYLLVKNKINAKRVKGVAYYKLS